MNEINSSSSDDDLYDNFEKYKRKHKASCKLSASDDKSCVISVLSSTSKCIQGKKSPVVEIDIIKVQKSKDKVHNNSIDFDAEFAEFSDLPPTKVAKANQKKKGVLKKDDDKLQNLLREAQCTLSFMDRPDFIAENSADEQILNGTTETSASFRKRCTLSLQNSKGQSFIVRCNMDEPFKNVMLKHSDRLEMAANKIAFMGKDRRFYPDNTPLDVGLDEENVHEIVVFEEDDSRSCMVSIKWLLKGRKPIVADVFLSKKFSELKDDFCNAHSLDPSKTQLIWDAEKLDEDETPESLELEDGDCIDVYVNG